MTDEKTTLPPARVEKALKDRLTAYAKSQDRSVSWVIKTAIKEYLDTHEEGSLGKDPDRPV
ncbi:CopG family ribbon-helix-helix protein [Actinomadura adrarensis]|uniref:CopG family ribbon-helix-helix protein n=1 Tax=Actinomadura adrarensis TaxID=1819600 RepID=A0ABW3CBB9_9ACTN